MPIYQIIGVTLFVFGLSYVINASHWMKSGASMKNSLMTPFFYGWVNLPVGLWLLHYTWINNVGDVSMLVRFIAALMVLKSLLFVLSPATFANYGSKKDSCCGSLCGVILLLIGAYIMNEMGMFGGLPAIAVK